MAERINTYSEFYRFYLFELRNKISRKLHFTGTFIAFVLLFVAIYFNRGWQWIFLPVGGFGFAWIWHTLFEKNKPVTFNYPLWNLLSDFKRFFEILNGKRNFDSYSDEK